MKSEFYVQHHEEGVSMIQLSIQNIKALFEMPRNFVMKIPTASASLEP